MAGFWATMPAAKGAIDAVKEMAASGLEVFVLSAPDGRFTGRCAMEKYQWLESHLGAEWKDRLILSTDKTLVQGT